MGRTNKYADSFQGATQFQRYGHAHKCKKFHASTEVVASVIQWPFSVLHCSFRGAMVEIEVKLLRFLSTMRKSGVVAINTICSANDTGAELLCFLLKYGIIYFHLSKMHVKSMRGG